MDTPYIYTVYCTIYELYQDGVRLSPEDARATAVQGWLYMHSKRSTGQPHACAYLLPQQGSSTSHPLLRPLDCVHLKLIDGGGMRLSGFYIGRDHKLIRQSWWVVPQ